MSTDRIINYARYERARNGLKAIVVLHLLFAGLTYFNGWADWWTNPVSRYGLLNAGLAASWLFNYDWRNIPANRVIVGAYFLLFALEMFRFGLPDTGYRSPPNEYFGRGGLFELVMALVPYCYVGCRFALGLLLLPLVRWGPKPR